MNRRLLRAGGILRDYFARAVSGPHMLAFLPALVLASYWFGGEAMLIVTALGFPLLLAVAGTPLSWPLPATAPPPAAPGADGRAALDAALGARLAAAPAGAGRTACFVLALDDHDTLSDRHGKAAVDRVLRQGCDRLSAVIRGSDTLCRLDGGRIALVLDGSERFDHEAALQAASRFQAEMARPVKVGAAAIHVTSSVGFCTARQLDAATGKALAEAALLALAEALRHGPAAVRVFSPDLAAPQAGTTRLADEICAALDGGQFVPWFQPQISSDTGQVSGVEALARWHHPVHGVLTPGDFLPILETTGEIRRLGEVMLKGALESLTVWSAEGLDIPHVGVNFSAAELRDPKLVDRVAWELDRHAMAPGRLAVEILETVVAISPDDTIARNIAGLAKMGCLIDLDDFGTGHASISSIRQFAVARLKIDRSFVTRVDRDAEQQRLVSAILAMAERLDLATVAEGVETAGEHAMLAQLGCDHVQGFGIARPMAAAQVPGWCRDHLTGLGAMPRIDRKSG